MTNVCQVGGFTSAPSSRSGSHLAMFRFHTVTLYPAFSRFVACTCICQPAARDICFCKSGAFDCAQHYILIGAISPAQRWERMHAGEYMTSSSRTSAASVHLSVSSPQIVINRAVPFADHSMRRGCRRRVSGLLKGCADCIESP